MNEFLKDDDPSHVPPDLGDEAVRERLSPVELKFFRRVMRIWQVPEEEALQLLGLAPGTTRACTRVNAAISSDAWTSVQALRGLLHS
jgi:hypothetical protein